MWTLSGQSNLFPCVNAKNVKMVNTTKNDNITQKFLLVIFHAPLYILPVQLLIKIFFFAPHLFCAIFFLSFFYNDFCSAFDLLKQFQIIGYFADYVYWTIGLCVTPKDAKSVSHWPVCKVPVFYFG